MLPSAAPRPDVTPTAPAATTQAPATDPTTAAGRQLTAEQVSQWRSRITAALGASKPAIDQGKTNVARYQGQYLQTAPDDHTALVPTDFYYVEAKKSQLFYRLPEIFVKPEQPGCEDAAIVFQAALNKELGPQGVNVLPTVQQVVFDLICPTGFGAVAVGYQTAVQGTVPVQIGTEPDPTAPPQTGNVLQLRPPMRPVMAPAPNIVAAWKFIEHIRPGDLIVDPTFAGLDFDKAAYVGQRFKEDVPEGDASGSTTEDDRRLQPLPGSAQAAQRKQRTGYEIWYRAYLFDPDVQHPDKIRTFKLYEDERSEPVMVRDHPHQRYKSAAGELAAGMRGYPICPVVLRYVSDSWMPPSDCTMARNTADELSKGRTQMLRSRDRNQPQWGFDVQRVDKDKQAAIERNEIQGGIPFNGPGADATWPIQKGNAPKETYTFNDVAQEDLKRIWRMGSNQIGVLDDKSRTATEQQITQNASQEASEADRNIVLNWYVNKVVTKFSALLQLYETQQQFVALVGSDAQRLTKIPPQVQQQAQQAGQDAHVLVPWNKDLIQGLFSFSVKPNSQVFVDAAAEKKQLMDLYQFFANNPMVNHGELTRQILMRYGFDPTKLMQAQPPRQAPPPGISLSIKGEDLSPLSPQSPILLEAMAQLGVPIDPKAVQAAQQLIASQQAALIPPPPTQTPLQPGPQTAHGGAAPKAEPLSKHPLEQTGGMQGTGAHAPLAPGGHV